MCVSGSYVSAYACVVNDLTKLTCTGIACVYVASINRSLIYAAFLALVCYAQCCKRKIKFYIIFSLHIARNNLSARNST